ncbi:MAG: thymidine phosphorylase [Thermomonas sp.]|uniref:thymidine phosphorylase n=1 Tax=Thermomonas sp. TaxID=1971895 RepID=UPI002632B6DC|nr:thymidine phosphorylase [Thermomonas sp.]MCC7097729.1 thymidine phosphorylase [Thermomonas sp.]
MTDWPAAALIRAKRQGRRLDAAQLHSLAQGIGSGRWSEGQVGAFAMAVALRGMEAQECSDFTLALRDSGRSLNWDDLPGPALDKHSTGGVGDCVSLALAPLVAACGGFVPMLSGRGLGHTGGTLDKLESLPGYNAYPTPDRLRAVVREVGCAVIGQTDDLVPADRRLYAIRDVTATVDVPELIVASILSKKLAGGAQALVLDVKVGNGAQTPEWADAIALATRMRDVASGSGLTLAPLLSDMGQVLGRDAGNALEVRAILDLLMGAPSCPRLRALVLTESARLLCLGGLADDDEDAHARLERALASGAAAERFARMVAALGGPADVLEHPGHHLPIAPVQVVIPAQRAGVVQGIDVRGLGECVIDLGGGRRTPLASIDSAVGLSEICEQGERVEVGQPLGIAHARTRDAAERAVAQVQAAFTLGEGAPAVVPAWEWLDA